MRCGAKRRPNVSCVSYRSSSKKKNSPSERSAHAGTAKCKGTSMSRSYTTINNVYGDRSFLTQAGLPLMIGVLVGPIEAQLRRLEPAQGRLKSQEVRVGNSWVRVGKTHSAGQKEQPQRRSAPAGAARLGESQCHVDTRPFTTSTATGRS